MWGTSFSRPCYSTSFIGANSKTFLLSAKLFSVLSPSVTSSYHVRPRYNFWFLPDRYLMFLYSCTPLLPTTCQTALCRCPEGSPNSLSGAGPTCLLGQLASVSLQVLLSPSLDSCSSWLLPEFSLGSLVFRPFTFQQWFSSVLSPLKPGSWPLPQTPHISLLRSLLLPSLLFEVFFLFLFEIQSPVHILQIPGSFPLFRFVFL